MSAWLAALAGIPLVLLAAKVHGRQLRLERESLGLGGLVDFGDPPAAVAKLWRRDRIRFWIALPALAALALAAGPWAGWPRAIAAAALGAPALAFALLGGDSLRRVAQPASSKAWWAALLAAFAAWAFAFAG